MEKNIRAKVVHISKRKARIKKILLLDLNRYNKKNNFMKTMLMWFSGGDLSIDANKHIQIPDADNLKVGDEVTVTIGVRKE